MKIFCSLAKWKRRLAIRHSTRILDSSDRELDPLLLAQQVDVLGAGRQAGGWFRHGMGTWNYVWMKKTWAITVDWTWYISVGNYDTWLIVDVSRCETMWIVSKGWTACVKVLADNHENHKTAKKIDSFKGPGCSEEHILVVKYHHRMLKDAHCITISSHHRSLPRTSFKSVEAAKMHVNKVCGTKGLKKSLKILGSHFHTLWHW